MIYMNRDWLLYGYSCLLSGQIQSICHWNQWSPALENPFKLKLIYWITSEREYSLYRRIFQVFYNINLSCNGDAKAACLYLTCFKTNKTWNSENYTLQMSVNICRCIEFPKEITLFEHLKRRWKNTWTEKWKFLETIWAALEKKVLK